VIWSFVLNGVSVFVLRYKQPNQQEFKVPPNITIAGREIPIGVIVITLVLLATALVNLFTKPAATVSGIIFSALLFIGFSVSEKRVQRGRDATHVEVDKFNLAQSEEITPDTLDVQPGNILVPVSTEYHLQHLENALRRTKRGRAEVVVLHVQLLKPMTVATELAANQMFSTIEQVLFSKVLSIAEREGKPVRLAVASANDLWDGILKTAANLQSGAVVVGSSSTVAMVDQARLIGVAWERMSEPRPRLTLEIFAPTGQEQIFYLGPHAPRLTPKEIDLLHKLWLEATDRLPEEEMHHHDIVHFALNEFERMIANGEGDDVICRLREHLEGIKPLRHPASDVNGPVRMNASDTSGERDSLRLNPELPSA